MTDALDPALPLSLLASSRDEFNAVFYEPVTVALQTKTNLHLHVLRVQNGDFDLPGLYRVLKNNSVAYVLSRLNYQKFLGDPGRAGPGRAGPGRAEPSRAEPSRAEPSRADKRCIWNFAGSTD
ncbi:MAG: hypothetical protein ACOH19_16905 [Rhodoglobus sp.]